MKGDPKVIKAMQELVDDEFAAIHQYMMHAEMAEHWGYGELHDFIQARIDEETEHAEKLIERALFLGITLDVSKLGNIDTGSEVPEQLTFDRKAEVNAITKYNKAIEIAREAGDNGSREMFEDILTDEEKHLHGIESQLDQVTQLGIQNFLTLQYGESDSDKDENP